MILSQHRYNYPMTLSPIGFSQANFVPSRFLIVAQGIRVFEEFHILTPNSISAPRIWGMNYHHPYCTNEETEAFREKSLEQSPKWVSNPKS